MKFLLVLLALAAFSEATKEKNPRFFPRPEVGDVDVKEKSARLDQLLKSRVPYQYKKGWKEVEGCGIKRAAPKIAFGEDTYEHEYPWQVLVADSFGWEYGGVLISDQHVLTSAYAALSEFWELILGAYDLSVAEGILVNTSQGVIHPNYDYFEYDIAIITLPEPIEISDNIRPICLPSRTDAAADLTGDVVTILGWGETEAHTTSNILREGFATVISQDECNALSADYYDEIPTTFFCTGLNESRSCVNDDGGPATIEKDSKSYVIGINTLMTGCSDTELEMNFPSLYTRISVALDFIESETGIAIDP